MELNKSSFALWSTVFMQPRRWTQLQWAQSKQNSIMITPTSAWVCFRHHVGEIRTWGEKSDKLQHNSGRIAELFLPAFQCFLRHRQNCYFFMSLLLSFWLVIFYLYFQFATYNQTPQQLGLYQLVRNVYKILGQYDVNTHILGVIRSENRTIEMN